MNVVKVPSTYKADLNRRYSLYKGTVPGLDAEQILDAITDMAIPIEIQPLYLYAIKSMERRPHIDKKKKIIIHDETFADTINFLELSYIGEDRPLIAWSVFSRVIAEFLYVDTIPGLGLYFADRIHEYASRFLDEDGYYIRPILLHGEYNANTPLEEVQKELDDISKKKLSYMRLQRAIIIFHEIGHALYHFNNDWRDAWKKLGPKLIDNMYFSNPLIVDQEFGILREKDLDKEKKDKTKTELLDKIIEEIASDCFALICIAANKDNLSFALEDAIRCMFRFMQFTDLVNDIRIQAKERARNKIRFRSLTSRLNVRTKALMSILKSSEKLPLSFLKVNSDKIINTLSSLKKESLFLEFQNSLKFAGHVMTLSIGGPAPWERDLHYGKVPSGYLAPQKEDYTLEDRERIFNSTLGDDYLYSRFEDSRQAPGYRAAGHLLCRSRAWANEFYSNKNLQKKYKKMAITDDLTSAQTRLAQTFNDVTRNKARLQYYFTGIGNNA